MLDEALSPHVCICPFKEFSLFEQLFFFRCVLKELRGCSSGTNSTLSCLSCLIWFLLDLLGVVTTTRASIFCSPASRIFMVLTLLNHNFDIIMLDRRLLQLCLRGMRLVELFSLLLLLPGYIGDLIVHIINIASFWVVVEISAVARGHELTLGVGLLVELLGCVTSFFALSLLCWCLVLHVFVLLC